MNEFRGHLYSIGLLFTAVPLVGGVIALVGIWSGHLSIVDSTAPVDARSLIGTLVQAFAGLVGVGLAALFVTAGLTATLRGPNLLATPYRLRPVLGILGVFVFTFGLGVVVFATFPARPAAAEYHWVDTFVLFVITSTVVLVGVVASQLENLQQPAIIARLARRISVKDIRSYGLARVERSHSGRVAFALDQHSPNFGRYDPLRALHEISSMAVGKDAVLEDRIAHDQVIRSMLWRVGMLCGTSFPLKRPNMDRMLRTRPVARLRATSEIERTQVTLHVLHYLVRRARNLATERSQRDVLRHAFVANIAQLMTCLSGDDLNESSVVLCLYAQMHIGLAYRDVQPYGRIEPLQSFVNAVVRLERDGRASEALLGAQILAVLVVRVPEVRSRLDLRFATLGSGVAGNSFRAGCVRALVQDDWLPLAMYPDRWRDE